MVFVGNDVVNIGHPANANRSLSSKFLAKVCSSKEQEYVLESESPNIALWQLWSLKESAFKVLMKMGEMSFFAPNRIEVLDTGIQNKKVIETMFKSNVVYLKSSVLNERITSVASNSLDGINKAVSETRITSKPDESNEVRRLMFDVLKRHNLPHDKVEVIKNEQGIPYLFYQKKILPIEISLSHDYGVMGVAILN